VQRIFDPRSSFYPNGRATLPSALGETVLIDLLQVRLSGVVQDGLFERQRGSLVLQLQDRNLVLEAQLLRGHASVGFFFTQPRKPGQEAPYELARLRPVKALETRLPPGEGVAKRRANRLVDRALYVLVAERRLGQVAVVHVAGEDDDGGRRSSPLPGSDAADQVEELDERFVERAPVVQILRAPDPLPIPSPFRPTPPSRRLRSTRDGFAPPRPTPRRCSSRR
jgi:hypothetical protein